MATAKVITPLLTEYPPYKLVCGTDEAGRGPLCGAVVAAAVILPDGYYHEALNDSKQIKKESTRELLYEHIVANALSYSIQEVDNRTIDQINILQASLRAMDMSIRTLSVRPDIVLVDGNQFLKNYYLPVQTVVKGDSIYAAIAAASILAKVHRDRLLDKMHEEYPMYGWKDNKGYGVPVHLAAIGEHGLTPYHRVKFSQKFVK